MFATKKVFLLLLFESLATARGGHALEKGRLSDSNTNSRERLANRSSPVAFISTSEPWAGWAAVNQF